MSPCLQSPDRRKNQKLNSDLESVNSQLQLLRKVRGKPSLVKQERKDVLFVYFSICKESLLDENRTGSINAVSRTAALLGRGKGTVSTIIKNWTDSFFAENDDINALTNSVGTNRRIGNTRWHSTKISEAPSVYVDVRNFVRSKCSQLERVTVTDIFLFHGIEKLH